LNIRSVFSARYCDDENCISASLTGCVGLSYGIHLPSTADFHTISTCTSDVGQGHCPLRYRPSAWRRYTNWQIT